MSFKGLQYHLNKLNPCMITYARELKGYTKKELAEILHKTPAALSRMESGSLKPDIETFFSISRTLSVDPQFFSREEGDFSVFDISRIHFRGQRKVTATQKKRLIRKGECAFDIINFFKKRGIIFPEDKISDLATTAKSQFEIEQLAIQARERLSLGFGPIDNLTNTIESNGYFIIKLGDGYGYAVDAFSSSFGGTRAIILCPHESTSRTLFSIAHELGHLLLHEYTDGSMQQEKEANAFASSFLLPWKTFKDECPKRWSILAFIEMKKRWKVSISAMLYRAKQLTIISDSTYLRALNQLRASGLLIKEPYEHPKENSLLFNEAVSLLNENNISITEVHERTGQHPETIYEILKSQDVTQDCLDLFLKPSLKRETPPLLRMS